MPTAALAYVCSYLTMVFAADSFILLNDLILISNELERTWNEGVVHCHGIWLEKQREIVKNHRIVSFAADF